MANISSAMTQVYAEGYSQVYAVYRIVGATSSDSIVVTTAFSGISAAIGMSPLSTIAAALTISGTTLTFAPLTLSTATLLLAQVVGPGV